MDKKLDRAIAVHDALVQENSALRQENATLRRLAEAVVEAKDERAEAACILTMAEYLLEHPEVNDGE